MLGVLFLAILQLSFSALSSKTISSFSNMVDFFRKHKKKSQILTTSFIITSSSVLKYISGAGLKILGYNEIVEAMTALVTTIPSSTRKLINQQCS